MPARNAIIATSAGWSGDCAALCAAHGVTARAVSDGFQALMAAGEGRPDILVCDSRIQGVDGIGFCASLRWHERLKGLEILVLMATVDAETTAHYERLGVHCASTVDELFNKLAAVLSQPLGGAAGHAPAPARPTAGPQPENDRPRILIVDDDRDVLRGLTVRLRAYDVDVVTETGGRDALHAAFAQKPHVIVTDYSMPQGNGEYFLLRLKEEPAMRDVPVIVMTGWTLDGQPDVAQERDMVGRCGAAVYLRKPVDFSTLLAELERHVTMRPKTQNKGAAQSVT